MRETRGPATTIGTWLGITKAEYGNGTYWSCGKFAYIRLLEAYAGESMMLPTIPTYKSHNLGSFTSLSPPKTMVRVERNDSAWCTVECVRQTWEHTSHYRCLIEATILKGCGPVILNCGPSFQEGTHSGAKGVQWRGNRLLQSESSF